MVLGTMTARVDALPAVGEEHVVVGEARGESGRKTPSAPPRSTTPHGRLVGAAEHVWIAVDPARLRLTVASAAGGPSSALDPMGIERSNERPGGATPSPTRSTSAASPTATATASATCRDHLPAALPARPRASTRSG